MSELARLLLAALAFACGLAIGWHGRGWNDGSTISVAAADRDTQAAVTAGADAAVSIDRAKSATANATERVRVVTRTVTVDSGCRPGAGAVSPELAQDLREAFE